MSEEDLMSPAPANRGRFVKGGGSPNPKGRPRKSKSIDDSMLNALNTRVTVNEGGRKKKISVQDATTRQLANKGAQGDLRAGKLVLDFAQKAEDRRAAKPAARHLTEADEAIVARLISRLRLIDKETDHGIDDA